MRQHSNSYSNLNLNSKNCGNSPQRNFCVGGSGRPPKVFPRSKNPIPFESAIKSFQVEAHTGNFFSEKNHNLLRFLIMIDAIIFNGFSTHQFSVLSFCEKAELVSMSNGSESYENENFQLYMRHAFSSEAQLGTIVGCHDQRRIFLVDGACDGKKCNCRSVAWQFLEGNLSREDIPIAIRDSVGHFPVNAVICDQEGCWWISSFSFGDTVIQPIRDGAYSFA